MKIKRRSEVEITIYANPLEDMDFLLFIDDLIEKYPYWKFQNPSYRVIKEPNDIDNYTYDK